MKVQNTFKSFLAAVAIFASFNASASLIFNFDQDLSDDQHSVNYTVGGYTLNVAAFESTSVANVHRQWNGLGVDGSGPQTNISAPESIVFKLDKVFNGTVEILFTNWNRFDMAEVSGSAVSTEVIAGVAANPFTSLFSGTEFTVTALEVANTINDKFRIQSITFTPDLSQAIPEPSTIAVLSLGLIGLGLRRRKSSK